MTTLNAQYYSENAELFYDATVNIDMTALYDEFLPLVKSNGAILDAGCGAGRDSKHFIEHGYTVQAFDASEMLVSLATALIKQPVQQALFQTFESDQKFDGIWACASLLHVPMNELHQVLQKLTSLLTTDGIFYCSFKLGNEEVTRNGRVFTNLDEESFEQYILDLPLYIVKQWRTGDLREGRESEQWLNVILRKETVNE
ncbi:class I SAM-dependent methyltransferase [Psychromonas aquatilis]|uniref:Methyltransferase domain-containing protein n=1 Tax=Psychromonas aquatilis TaxID=2005072 RepID=A0ABU9GN96_9GAMM